MLPSLWILFYFFRFAQVPPDGQEGARGLSTDEVYQQKFLALQAEKLVESRVDRKDMKQLEYMKLELAAKQSRMQDLITTRGQLMQLAQADWATGDLKNEAVKGIGQSMRTAANLTVEINSLEKEMKDMREKSDEKAI
jgi:hypothetical protein